MQTLVTCLHPLIRHSSPPPTHSPSPSSPITPHTPTPNTHFLTESAYPHDNFFEPQPLIGESVYYSLHEGYPHDNQTGSLNSTPRRGKGNSFLKQLPSGGKVARKQRQQLLLVATEELVSAHFSINEVLLTLSSKGTCTYMYMKTHVYSTLHTVKSGL